MPDCLFCKIIQSSIPSTKVHEDELSVGFLDVTPQAPEHILFVPKLHLTSTDEMRSEHRELIGHLALCAAEYARQKGFADSGYRLVFNCNRAAGQTVPHIHLHLLGGREFNWPPG